MKLLAHVLMLALPLCAAADLCDFVDPFVGTAGTGHTFPAACVPLGLVQAGPDTGNEDWAHCAGYQFGDKRIFGFSQTHLNGTGCADLGDVRLLPFVGERVPEAVDYDKASEQASPGRYAVTLGGVSVEVSATARAAIYRFRNAKGGRLRLLVDAQWGLASWGEYPNRVAACEVVAEEKRGVSGWVRAKQWNRRTCAFAVRFDREAVAVAELPHAKGVKVPRYVFDFELGTDETLSVKVGLSRTSVEAAKRNLAAEIPGWDFAAVVKSARAKWTAVFEKATAEGTDDQKRNWYTSLYHLYIQPNDISDVGEKPFYSTLSCWDTFRAAAPLYTILTPDAAAAFVDSILRQGEMTGYLPIWTLWGEENQGMIGTHSIPMIVDAWLKGAWPAAEGSGSTVEAAYRQIRETLTKRHEGREKENWDVYDKYGYYPFDIVKSESVSRTLECAYDDWCAAQMAEKLGKPEDAAFFRKRSGYWKNVFDPKLLLARGRDSSGAWREPFDPARIAWGSDYTEGNSLQYSWHVMQDPAGLVAFLGGREAAVRRLDGLFGWSGKFVSGIPDVTGLIGQYAHGNEPCHHVAYFYSLLGEPRKAADRIREIFDKFYLPKPDGLCGNDDCGQMSAWYLFGAMGFYPFNPCGGDYVLGAPQVPKVEVNRFTVIARGLSKENKYVKSVTLNGKPLEGPVLKHADVMKGGELVFEMCR